MSSRDRRFSEAVKLPCESGEGRARRGVADDSAEPVPVVDADADTAEVTVVADEVEGRADVAVDVDVDEDADPLRI